MESRMIAVTNRHLGQRPFLEQIGRICRRRPRAVLLREKDLPEDAYVRLLEQVLKVCARYDVPCIPHTYMEAARRLGLASIHLPFSALKEYPEAGKFFSLGVSVHSPEEALAAGAAGAAYLTAGHIFPTACKPGLAPRGTGFLREVCAAADIPVYAIGGMEETKECMDRMVSCGAAGICLMSGCMRW